jgi:hypothetical protein
VESGSGRSLASCQIILQLPGVTITETALTYLALIYSGLVFCAVTGVIQAAAAHNNLRGILFFQKNITAYIFACLTCGFSLFVFFIWNYRYETGVIEGSQQAGLFALSAVLAIIFTLVLSSIIKFSSLQERSSGLTGLAFFKKATLFSIFRRKLVSKER